MFSLLRFLLFRFDEYLFEDYGDYHYGELLPSTGYFRVWDMQQKAGGFMFIFPDSQQPDLVADYRESPHFFSMFSEGERWGYLMDCQTVADLNDLTFDYPADSVFPVAGCGFGAVMMTTELLRRIRENFGLPFSPFLGFGEDLSFCMRVTQLGETIWCDSRIKLGHVGLAVYDEETYRQRPVKAVNL